MSTGIELEIGRVPPPPVKVLVMDDEQGLRDMLSYELASRGFVVVAVPDGEEGVEKVRAEKFDLVISDIRMPRMNGIAALEEILKIDPRVQVIITTAFGTIEVAVEAMEKGAYDVVIKPYDLKDLLSKIDKALAAPYKVK